MLAGFGLGSTVTPSLHAQRSAMHALYQKVRARAPEENELRIEVNALRTFHRATNDWTEAWVAACVTQLTGPAALYPIRAEDK
jgi:hypothetical protein